MTENYEINVDPDMANHDALTIFINYRVFDFSGKEGPKVDLGIARDCIITKDRKRRLPRLGGQKPQHSEERRGYKILAGITLRAVENFLHPRFLRYHGIKHNHLPYNKKSATRSIRIL